LWNPGQASLERLLECGARGQLGSPHRKEAPAPKPDAPGPEESFHVFAPNLFLHDSVRAAAQFERLLLLLPAPLLLL